MSQLSQKILNALEFTSGCTEPAAIAYAAAWVGSVFPGNPDALLVELDHRTYKNAFAAGIPNGEGHTGAEMATILGFLIGDPVKKLSIFLDLTPGKLEEGKRLMGEGIVKVDVQTRKDLHIHITAENNRDTASALIQNSHTALQSVTLNSKQIFSGENDRIDASFLTFQESDYNWENWENMVDEAVKDLVLRQTLEKGIQCNSEAADYGKLHLDSGEDDLVSGAIFSRMTGDPIMVMSCAGSGNKGLTSIVPVLAMAKRIDANSERRLKAVTLSALVTSLVTARFGAVSSTCGVLYAAGAGLVASFLFLKDRLELFPAAYRNYISAVAGAFCDGAKGSCAMRGTSAVQNALKSVQFAVLGFQMKDKDGFLGCSFLETLDNLLLYNPSLSEFDNHTIGILREKDGKKPVS
jgi:L-cysteine desulfidase